jgi:Barstar (barnase inhibitor)
MLKAGVYRLNDKQASEVSRDLAPQGARVINLPGDIRTKAAFIAAVREVAPLDPPLFGESNWDAFEDSLWEGLRGLPEDKIVIVWPNANLMSEKNSQEYEAAHEILSNLTNSLASLSITQGTPKELIVILS